MARYHGKKVVRDGFYWSPATWEIVVLGAEGGVLPGETDQRYVRLPALLMLGMGPVLGALLVVFLPFIGFAMLLAVAGRKLLVVARRALSALLAEPEVAIEEERR